MNFRINHIDLPVGTVVTYLSGGVKVTETIVARLEDVELVAIIGPKTNRVKWAWSPTGTAVATEP